MSTSQTIDAGRVSLLLNELRLPAVKLLWPKFAEQADKEGWPAARFLATIVEHEIAERARRRIERHLAEARLPPGKTLDTFDFDSVPMISKAQVMATTAGDIWLAKGANLLLFGPPGGGKSHLAAAIGLALVENGWRVFFTRTTDLVQRLQVARRELALEAAINRLDRFDLVILDDLAYVSKDQAETSVLFELISARYERRSILITANQPFGEWGKVFPDPAMTLAAIDRLVHHSTIFEMNVESYRRRTAINRQRGPGRPPSRATPKTLKKILARDNHHRHHHFAAIPTRHPDCRRHLIQIVALDVALRLGCEATKDRTGDYFGAIAREMSESAERHSLKDASNNARLAVLASSCLPWRRRLRAALLLSETEDMAAERALNFAPISEVFRALGVPDDLMDACEVYRFKARDPLSLLVPLAFSLWRAEGSPRATITHALPAPHWIGELPDYAFDPIRTRLGRRAIDLWLRSYLEKPPFEARQVAIALWNAESAACTRSLDWSLGREIMEQASFADLSHFGVPMSRHEELKAWISKEQSVLACARTAVWQSALRRVPERQGELTLAAE